MINEPGFLMDVMIDPIIRAIIARADKAKADNEPSEFIDGLLVAADIAADFNVKADAS